MTRLGDYWTLGNFLKPLATINFPKSPTFLGNFLKVSKSIIFLSKSIIFLVKSFLGNFYTYLAIFFWTHCNFVPLSDKQQEVDIQSLRTQQDDGAGVAVVDTQRSGVVNDNDKAGKSGPGSRSKTGTMSQISGVRRSLSHANSLPAGSAPLPKFGVPTDKETELSEVKKPTDFHCIADILINIKILESLFSGNPNSAKKFLDQLKRLYLATIISYRKLA